MIFMSQSGLTDPSRENAWAAWYADHVRIMVTVVFDDPYYRSVRGMGEWQPLIDTRHYHRNLFSGLDVAPDVPEGAVLIVADRDRPTEFPRLALTWLTAVGLDRSTPYRGIAVVDTTTADALVSHDVAVYRTNGRRVSAR
jgi:hypothetical protein